MQLTRRPGIALAVLVAIVAVWSAVQASQREIVTLRTWDGAGEDLFTTLWVAEDEYGFVWLRANRPDRKWLVHVAKRPEIELRRNGRSQPYVAKLFDDDVTRRAVAPLFREKYGLADGWRELTQGTETIPVRLQPR